MRVPGALIRNPGSDRDWTVMRELCCRTGNSGAEISRERWPFFSEYWIGPYQRLLPAWSYVAEVDGAVKGYLTGCPDTLRFDRRKRLHSKLPLLLDVLRGRYVRNNDLKRFVLRTLHLEKTPERRFPVSVHRTLAKQYPAHLHVNIDVSCRGQGLGQLLVEKFCADLRHLNVPGLHVYCGAGPVRFYKAVGFTELASIDDPAHVYCLVRTIAP
ncbi:MAG: GNAT family N-acetyltransferase [Deltaproteobacteria bacterium]|nr:GNAT family N-acetyltransferase [Deltaproteobacteria bacterium]